MSFAIAPVATPERARAFTAAVSLTAAAAAAGGVVAIAAGVVRNDTRTLAAVTLVAALSFVGSGLVAWRRRPDVWTGALMIAAGFALFAGSLANSNSALPFTIGLVLAPLPSAIIGHLILSFPEGRLHSTLERLVVAGAYFVVFVVQIVMLMFMGFEHVTGCPCPTNLLFIRDDMALHSLIMSTQRFLGIVLAIAAAWIVVRRWQNASGPLRRALAPILVTGSATIVLLLAELIAANSSTRAWAAVSSAERVAIALVPIAYLVGLFRARLGRVAVSDLVIELGRMPAEPGHLRDALSRALRDPSLELAYWVPESETYVGIDGRTVEPAAAAGQTVTVLERHGQRIAALVHDPALGEDPALLSAVSTAAGLALENERLLAELRAQLERLRESRARIVEAGDTERRRLERNLHDGAQQRLLALSYDIRLARASAGEEGDTPTEMALARAVGEIQDILQELRELAHGIYPAVLAEAGIAPALATLADTAALPVEILRAEHDRYPDPVESAAYFTVAEALADAARRGAGHATVTVAHEAGRLVVTVEDNGSGDVSPMVAAADRVGALGGSLSAEPARCRAEIPCASS